MHSRYNSKLQRDVMTIYPGEFHVDSKDLFIYTVLGSCISVCLYDSEANVGGMNHFMLAGLENIGSNFASQSTRYGMAAMEVLINEIMKKGGKKERFEAKVFGGANMIRVNVSDQGVAQNNIKFAKWFLDAEDIKVASIDVGGDKARKVFFNPFTQQVFLKHLVPEINDLEKEISYERKLIKTPKSKVESSDVELF